MLKIFSFLTLTFVVGTSDPVSSVQGLISRILGNSALDRFQLEVIPADSTTGLDVFEIASSV